MKKVWLMLAAALFCGSAGAAAPELFRPDEALKKKIAADPEMKRILYQAHRTMLSPVMAKVRPDRGNKYTLWYFGTTFTYWMEGLGYSYMVTGDGKYAKKAVELIVSTCRDFPVNDEKLSSGLVCERGQFLYGLAVGCFFFFDKLTPEEQQLVADTAAGYIDETLKEADKPETWWYDIHNHNGVMFGPAGIISLFFQDRPGYKKRVADCVRILKRWINSGFDDKGLPCEGSVYARYSALRVMLFATLLRDQGGEDLFKTTKLKKWPHVYPAKMIPGTNLVETRNDAYYAPPSLECLFVSAANQDPVAEWIWRNWSDRGREYFPLNLLLEARRRPEPALELSKYPPERIFQAALSVDLADRLGQGRRDVFDRGRPLPDRKDPPPFHPRAGRPGTLQPLRLRRSVGRGHRLCERCQRQPEFFAQQHARPQLRADRRQGAGAQRKRAGRLRRNAGGARLRHVRVREGGLHQRLQRQQLGGTGRRGEAGDPRCVFRAAEPRRFCVCGGAGQYQQRFQNAHLHLADDAAGG